MCFIRPGHAAPRDSGRESLLFLRRGSRREGDDGILLPELRPEPDWALYALPGPVRRVSLPRLLVHGPLRSPMGTVAITFRILPEDADVDIEGLKASVRDALGASLRDMQERPVAFGIKAIEAIAVVDDAAGGSDALEHSLAEVPGVGTVETIDVTLV